MVKELLGDGLDVEGFFDVAQAWVVLGVLEQAEKAGLRRVAAFALADDVGETPGGREASFNANFAGVVLDGGIFHLDVGEAPLPFGGRDERD